jgi:hypothetical protein
MREKEVHRDFKAARRAQVMQFRQEEERFGQQAQQGRHHMHREDQTFSCLTQNVNGFGSNEAHRDEWFRAVKKSDGHGRYDIVFLQETHVEPEDVAYMTGLHARTWGFREGVDCPVRHFGHRPQRSGEGWPCSWTRTAD